MVSCRLNDEYVVRSSARASVRRMDVVNRKEQAEEGAGAAAALETLHFLIEARGVTVRIELKLPVA